MSRLLVLYSCLVVVHSQGLLGGLGDTLKNVTSGLLGNGEKQGSGQGSGGLLGGLGDTLKNVTSGLTGGGKQGSGGLGDVVKGLGKAVNETVNGLTGCKCPQGNKCSSCPGKGGILGGLGDVVGGTAGGLVDGLSKALTPAVQGVLSALSPVVQGLLGAVGGVLDLVLNLVSSVLALLLGILAQAGPDVSEVLGPLISLINSTGAQQDQCGFLSNLIKNIENSASGLLQKAGLNSLGPLLSVLESLIQKANNACRRCSGPSCSTGGNKNCSSCAQKKKPCSGCPSRNASGQSRSRNSSDESSTNNSMSDTPTNTLGWITCPGDDCLARCVATACRVVCLATGCTINGIIVNGRFEDVMTEAKKRKLGFAGTVTGLPTEDNEGLFDGQLGEQLTSIGFNPNAFIGQIGIVPDALTNAIPYNGLYQVRPTGCPPTNSGCPVAQPTRTPKLTGCPAGQNSRTNNSNNNRRGNQQNRRTQCPRNYVWNRNRCLPVNKPNTNRQQNNRRNNG